MRETIPIFKARTPPLETPRLLLSPLRLDDAPQVQILFPHWEIVRYLSNRVPWPYPPDGAHTFYRDVALPAVERGDAWHWMLGLKSDPGRVIGSIGLVKGKDKNRGFWLGAAVAGAGVDERSERSGDGLLVRRAEVPGAARAQGRSEAASRRISEKNGMRVVATEERDYVSGRLPTEIWEITADEWHARRRAK